MTIVIQETTTSIQRDKNNISKAEKNDSLSYKFLLAFSQTLSKSSLLGCSNFGGIGFTSNTIPIFVPIKMSIVVPYVYRYIS